MSKKELLIAGSGTTGFQRLNDLFNQNGDWKTITASGDEDAIEKFHRYHFEVVVLTDAVSTDEEKKIRKIFTFHNPDIIIVKNQNGNEGVLVTEIVTALDKLRKAKKPSYSLVDDALKNAGLNIIIE